MAKDKPLYIMDYNGQRVFSGNAEDHFIEFFLKKFGDIIEGQQDYLIHIEDRKMNTKCKYEMKTEPLLDFV